MILMNEPIDQLNPFHNPVLYQTTHKMSKKTLAATNGHNGHAHWVGAGDIGSDTEGTFEIPDNIPRIKACVTMWHETREEIIEIMKSIYRMDQDQCTRRISVQHFELDMYEIGYYEYETHIFFDDAFTEHRRMCASRNILNEFVKTFLSVMDNEPRPQPPQKFDAPYGSRLVWTLPGKTKLFVHLKDKSKIRHNKRWSQCMYIYYLLRYQLRIQGKHVGTDRLDAIEAHTFLLALDGDVSFTPRSVQLLVDAMKENDNLGAVCGRIHPSGSGPMVWYQKFEYATAHWLQKTAEDILGCVLCSPGCFSLFRGRALLNKAVMNTYATTSSEPRHYVQYDQGEDRWLCTLLVKQAYRVGYSAASDAYTHAPENLAEFYRQRRRWEPSVAANTMDVVTNAIRNKSGISVFFITYQIFLLIAAILGPGTFIVLLAGACITLFELDTSVSFAVNLAPVVIFAIVCTVCKNGTQLKMAKILSVVYALLMAGVFVGIVFHAYEKGILSPPFLLPLMVTGIFTLAAALHPSEVGCLVHGIIYYLMLPSAHLLLTVFTVFNLNNVSWGTRERPELQNETKKQPEIWKKEFMPGEKIYTLPEDEIDFWNELISKHLFPLDADPTKEQTTSEALLSLRNTSVFYFLLANGIFVLLIYILTLHKEWLSVEWPFGDNNFNLEPIGFVFVIFVVIILVVQFVALLVHRFRVLYCLIR